MKAFIGFLFFLLFLAGFFLVFIQGKHMADRIPAAAGAEYTGKEWRPVYISAEAVPEDAGIYVQFAMDGSIEGNAGCNAFFGSLEVSETSISVGQLGSTRMACPEPIMERENAFLAALNSATVFEVSGNRLTCLGADRKLLVEMVAATEPEE